MFTPMDMMYLTALQCDNHAMMERMRKDMEKDRQKLEEKEKPAEPEETPGDRLIRQGGWKCAKCGTINASYVGTCKCGQEKDAIGNIGTKTDEQENPAVAQYKQELINRELGNIEVIKGYKELLDLNIITEEEFEKKKQELLKL